MPRCALVLALLAPATIASGSKPGAAAAAELLLLSQPDYQHRPGALSLFTLSAPLNRSLLATLDAVNGSLLQDVLHVDAASQSLFFAALTKDLSGTVLYASELSSAKIQQTAEVAGGVPHLAGVVRGALWGIRVQGGVPSLFSTPTDLKSGITQHSIAGLARGLLPQGVSTACAFGGPSPTAHPYTFSNVSHLITIDLIAASASDPAVAHTFECNHRFASLQYDCSSSAPTPTLFGIVVGGGAPTLVRVELRAGKPCALTQLASLGESYDVAPPTALLSGAQPGAMGDLLGVLVDASGRPSLMRAELGRMQPPVTWTATPLDYAPIALSCRAGGCA